MSTSLNVLVFECNELIEPYSNFVVYRERSTKNNSRRKDSRPERTGWREGKVIRFGEKVEGDRDTQTPEKN